MNIKQWEQLQRLSNQYLDSLDDNFKNEFWASERELNGDVLSGFLDFLRDKLDFESDEVVE